MPTIPPSQDSMTVWFAQLSQGNPDAAAKLWERFFDRLVAIARQQMATANRRVADEEDIAAGVMTALCRCATRGNLPSVQNRDDLWQQLLSWMKHDVIDHVRATRSAKRGSDRVRGGSVFDHDPNARPNDAAGFEQIADRAATPDMLVEMDEQLRILLDRLPEQILRQLAIGKMEGFTNEELAAKIGVSTRTVDRKLKLIRSYWT